MTDDVLKTVKIAGEDVKLTEPVLIPPAYGDVVLDVRLIGTTVYLAFGAHILEGSGPAEVRVTSRLRLTLEAASHAQSIIAAAMEAAAQSKKAAN